MSLKKLVEETNQKLEEERYEHMPIGDHKFDPHLEQLEKDKKNLERLVSLDTPPNQEVAGNWETVVKPMYKRELDKVNSKIQKHLKILADIEQQNQDLNNQIKF